MYINSAYVEINTKHTHTILVSHFFLHSLKDHSDWKAFKTFNKLNQSETLSIKAFVNLKSNSALKSNKDHNYLKSAFPQNVWYDILPCLKNNFLI